MTTDRGVAPQRQPAVVANEAPPRRFTRLDWLLVGGIGARALYGLAMLPLIPVLIVAHPLLLALLSGSTVAEVVVGARVRLGEIPWIWALLAGTPLWVLTDWLYWAAGRRWGDRVLARMLSRGDAARGRQRAARAEAVIDRFGAWGVVLAKFFPVPSQLVFAAAGTAGMRLRVFVVLDFLGTLLAVSVAVSLGYALGQRAVDVVELFKHYAVLTAVVLVGVVAVVLLVRHRWRGRAAADADPAV